MAPEERHPTHLGRNDPADPTGLILQPVPPVSAVRFKVGECKNLAPYC